VQADCDNFQNVLTWENLDPDCSSDIEKYVIYYQPPQAESFVPLDSTEDLTYTHSNLSTIAGCYTITAVDSIGNRSSMSDTVCIDSDACGTYHLPNMFTPNGDERNDFFVPFPYSGVEKIDLKIFNRWGNLIFSTQDPAIKWDGKIQGSNQPVSDGVYYYVCDVYELTLNGTVKRTIKGSITVIR
jgi:gliding motility-associated-like protein